MTNAQIEAFLAVCEYKSISRAAERLFISQSSLSTKMRTLENETGCLLIERRKGGRTVALTEAGETFYRLSLQYREITRQMLALGRANLPDKLRVATINSLGTYLFPSVYERFLQKSPDTVLEVQEMASNTACLNLENGLTDLAFTPISYSSQRVLSFPVFSEAMVFVCSLSSDYPEVVEAGMLDVKKEVYINWSDPFQLWHETSLGDPLHSQIKLEIMGQLQYFVMKGRNWAIVPASVAHGLCQNGGIKRCRMAFAVPNRIVNCFYLSDRAKDGLIDCFNGCLREVLLGMNDSEIKLYI